MSNTLTPDQVAEKVYTGEWSTVDDLRMAVKLLLNASGTNLNQVKDHICEQIEFSSLQKNINGTRYIPVETVIDIIKKSE